MGTQLDVKKISFKLKRERCINELQGIIKNVQEAVGVKTKTNIIPRLQEGDFFSGMGAVRIACGTFDKISSYQIASAMRNEAFEKFLRKYYGYVDEVKSFKGERVLRIYLPWLCYDKSPSNKCDFLAPEGFKEG